MLHIPIYIRIHSYMNIHGHTCIYTHTYVYMYPYVYIVHVLHIPYSNIFPLMFIPPLCTWQVMTGRRPTDKTIGDSGLTKWVSSHWSNNEAIKVIDPRLRLEESIIPEVSGALKLGLMCTSRNMRDRPSMEDVVHLLENLDMFGGMDRFDMNDMEEDRCAFDWVPESTE